jgi:diguanylate cyclase (GGDEF)-like protein
MEDLSATPSVDLLAEVAQRLGASLDLTQTLEQITRVVVDSLGFGVATLNLRTGPDDFEVVAITGPDEVRQALQGRHRPEADWDEALTASQHWGRLRFLDGRDGTSDLDHLYWYVPDVPADDDPESWHPMDALFAPLYGADGALCAVLSVDLPLDGRRPDANDCRLLEHFAIQAALAIDHARLYADLQQAMEEQTRVQRELQHRALHDSLTGLANRELLLDRLDQALARSRRDGRAVAVLFLDLDHFKLVNDSLGHAVGDELLVAVAALLQQHLREVDTAGRLGGDEFVLVLEELTGPAEAIAVAERLLIASRQAVPVGGELMRTSLSIGIAVASARSTSSELLAEADAALYRAKAAGRGRWEVFDSDMRSEALAQLALRSELSQALDGQQFDVFYQPIVRISDARVLGYEALLRWQHPTRGLLLPAAFLSVLEDGDSDSPVAEWVLERVCADAASWGGSEFVSVNISPRQLARPELARRVASVLERTGLDADRLWVEITEDRPVDAQQDIADVRRLRDLGVHVVLDDFGSGYAGLSYLQRLPADVVKIDAGFIAGIAEDPVSRGIVGAVVGLAEVLGLSVVGEGVETAAQADILHTLGVTLGQGFLWGRPGSRPTSPDPIAAPRAQLVDDLQGDLRRLQAALAVAADRRQVARVSIQACLRSVGADAGSFTILEDDGLVHRLHSVGFDQDLIEPYRVMPLSADLPVCQALREGTPVWMLQDALLAHPRFGRAKGTAPVFALGCVPAGRAAVSVVWFEPVALEPELKGHLDAMTALISDRLNQLTH